MSAYPNIPSGTKAVEGRNDRSRETRGAHGYLRVPPVDDALPFCLPTICHSRSRTVFVDGRGYLIWSPNSAQDPYYPGVFPPLSQGAQAAERSQRCLDGHSGPSDFTRVPQVYNWLKPWLGFLVRESRSSDQDIEYVVAYSVWRNPVGATDRGRIDPEHVERLLPASRELEGLILNVAPEIESKRPSLGRHRPRWRNDEVVTFKLLREISAYEDAVDQLAEAHRGLREMRAWYTMANLLLRPNQIPHSRDPILTADDRYLSVWVNRAELNDCWWFLTRAALPCFIIHALPASEPSPPDACVSFLERTELETMMDSSTYEFDRIAAQSGCRYTLEEKAPIPYNTRARTAEERQGSSLHWQLNRVGEDLPAGARRPSTPLREASSAKSTAPITHDRTPAPSTSGPLSTNYDVSALIPVDAERVPWLRPPTISGVGAKGWITFRQSYKDEEEKVVYMREVGKNSKERRVAQGEVEAYNRHLHRRLIFKETPPLDAFVGLTTGPEYGRPVPDWPFLYKSGEQYLARKGSKWMYMKEKPFVEDIGKVADPPTKDLLPRLNGGKFLRSAGAWAWDDSDDSEEERVSLGPSEGESSRTPTIPTIPGVALSRGQEDSPRKGFSPRATVDTGSPPRKAPLSPRANSPSPAPWLPREFNEGWVPIPRTALLPPRTRRPLWFDAPLPSPTIRVGIRLPIRQARVTSPGITCVDEPRRGCTHVNTARVRGPQVDLRMRKGVAPAGVIPAPLLVDVTPLAQPVDRAQNKSVVRDLTPAPRLDLTRPRNGRLYRSLPADTLRQPNVLPPRLGRGIGPRLQDLPLPRVGWIHLSDRSPGRERPFPFSDSSFSSRSTRSTRSPSSSPPPVVKNVAMVVSHETPSLLLRLEEPKEGSSSIVEDACPRLLNRLPEASREPQTEGEDPSLFQRLGVPLEQRLGNMKPRRYRKHNRTQKQLKKEGEEFARRIGGSDQQWEDERAKCYATERLRILEQQREY
ncbi:hypothetical protein K438DRAFT_1776884 [Mycena galopus ATCC 62051]|nr:hypothetical protein K438DRAFT_1776884 [Mycena galopus ATCC 62051]